MDLTQLANLGEFIGGVAVLVTLVYLAVQTRQTRAAAEETAKFASVGGSLASVERYGHWREMVLRDPNLADLLVKANQGTETSESEGLRLSLVFDELFFVGAVGFVQGTSGSTAHTPLDVDYLVAFLRKNPCGIPEWERLKEMARTVSPDFVSSIDEGLGASAR